MGAVLNMQDINNGRRVSEIEWAEVRYNKDGQPMPLKIWENLECILEHYNIKVSLNEIDHEIYYEGISTGLGRNNKLTDVYSLQLKEGLNLSRDETMAGIKRIAEKNKFNPFVTMLKENKNDNYDLIMKVFSTLDINDENVENNIYYYNIFLKWCVNVVKMANNTLENDYSSQGVLVLQGKQGCFKSTFCRNLMPRKEWFKGDKSLEPDKVDSVMQNTRYILVEWGELDSTLKGEQAKLKQFITSTNDEYRSPCERLSEKHPRLTSYIGTVNKKDFLKDETGSRRFWIIPINMCDTKKLNEIDMKEFWGAVYSLWLSGDVKEYLSKEEQETLSNINKEYNYENDISIKLEDELDWSMPENLWVVYKPSEIANRLSIFELKKLKIELEKRGIYPKVHKVGGKCIRGYRIPNMKNQYY